MSKLLFTFCLVLNIKNLQPGCHWVRLLSKLCKEDLVWNESFSWQGFFPWKICWSATIISCPITIAHYIAHVICNMCSAICSISERCTRSWLYKKELRVMSKTFKKFKYCLRSSPFTDGIGKGSVLNPWKCQFAEIPLIWFRFLDPNIFKLSGCPSFSSEIGENKKFINLFWAKLR